MTISNTAIDLNSTIIELIRSTTEQVLLNSLRNDDSQERFQKLESVDITVDSSTFDADESSMNLRFLGTATFFSMERIETDIIDYNVALYTFQCNDSFNSDDNTLTQGSIMQVCVSSNDTQFNIAGIYETIITQDGVENKIVTDFDAFAYPSLTAIECNTPDSDLDIAGRICYLKFQLLASYFENNEPGAITVSGDVKLHYINDRRLLRSDDIKGTAKVTRKSEAALNHFNCRFLWKMWMIQVPMINARHPLVHQLLLLL